MASIGIYTEYVESYNIFFKWTASSRMKHIYHSLLKINDDHKYLKCPDIWEKNWCSIFTWFMDSFYDWISWRNFKMTSYWKCVPHLEIRKKDWHLRHITSISSTCEIFSCQLCKIFQEFIKITYQRCNGYIKCDEKCG